MNIQENVSLAPYTTFSIGGPARFFVSVTTLEELEEAVIFAKAKGLPKLVLGGGSNILVSDSGFEGVVIHIQIKGVEVEEDVLIAGAGEEWGALVERGCTEGLWGRKRLSGNLKQFFGAFRS